MHSVILQALRIWQENILTSYNHMFLIQPINVISSLPLRISVLTYFIALQILQSSAHRASSGRSLTRLAGLGSQC